MSLVWIAHSSAPVRAAVEQQLPAASRVRSGDCRDPAFERAEPPELVVLGTDDLEAALSFAHRHATRAGGSRWLLLHERSLTAASVVELFGGVRHASLAWPASTAALRRALADLALPETPSLAARLRQDALERQAQQYFADLRIDALEQARARVDRLLIRGEAGTGRLLLARVLHLRSRSDADPFAVLPCDETSRPVDLARATEAIPRGSGPLTLCVQEVDRLDPATQSWLRAWIEVDAGPDLGRPLRWLGTAGPDGSALELELEACLARERVELPPLRERTELIEPFALVTTAAFAQRRGVEPPEITPEALFALRDHPWPGNLRELEGVLARALARRPEGPIGAEDLPLGRGSFDDHRDAGVAPGPDRGVAPGPDRGRPAVRLVDDEPLPDADEAPTPRGSEERPQAGADRFGAGDARAADLDEEPYADAADDAEDAIEALGRIRSRW